MGQDQHEMGLAGSFVTSMARKKLFLISRVGGSMPQTLRKWKSSPGPKTVRAGMFSIGPLVRQNRLNDFSSPRRLRAASWMSRGLYPSA